MSWTSWLSLILCALLGSWLIFDGVRAFATGDYTTPSAGEHQGQLGPWASFAEAVGIDPRSPMMKTLHILVGVINVVAAVSILTRSPWSNTMVIIASISALWYVPFGSVIGVFLLVMTVWLRLSS
jgi:hypothetical protein